MWGNGTVPVIFRSKCFQSDCWLLSFHILHTQTLLQGRFVKPTTTEILVFCSLIPNWPVGNSTWNSKFSNNLQLLHQWLCLVRKTWPTGHTHSPCLQSFLNPCCWGLKCIAGKEIHLLENVSIITLHAVVIDYPLFWKQIHCHISAGGPFREAQKIWVTPKNGKQRAIISLPRYFY